MNALAALLFLFFRKRLALTEDQQKLWRNISLCTLGLIILLAVVPSSTAIDRFLLYFFPLQFVVLSRLPNSLTQERYAVGQITLVIIAYAALVQFTFLTFGTFAYAYLPYRSLLFG